MAPDRRSVLKSIGAASTVSMLTVGSAMAKGCIQTVDVFNYTDSITGLPLTGTGAGQGVFYTSDPFSTDSYASADFEGRRIVVTYEYNPTPQGPNSSNIRLEKKTAGDQWTTVVEKSSEDLSPTGINIIELEAVDGDSASEVSGDAVVEDGIDYRVYIDQPNSTGVAVDFEINVEFQAFEPGCLDE